MVWPQIREGALARHCHFRFAKGAGRWTSVWASLRERGKAKRPPHVGPEKVVLPAASPKELGSDLPRPKKGRAPTRDLALRLLVPRARRLWLTPQPEPGEKQTVRGTPWARLPFDLWRPPPRSVRVGGGKPFFVPKQRTARSDDPLIAQAVAPSVAPGRRLSLTREYSEGSR